MNKELSLTRKVLLKINAVLEYLDKNKNQEHIIDLIDSVQSLHLFLYGIESSRFKEYSDNAAAMDVSLFLKEVKKFAAEAEVLIEKLSRYSRKTDYDFYKLMEYVNAASEKQMLDIAFQRLVEIFSNLDEKARRIVLHNWNIYSHLWGAFDPVNGIFDHLSNAIHELKLNREKIIALYEMLSDYRSKTVFYSVIYFWLYLDVGALDKAKETTFDDYYDHDILNHLTQDETVVDCGAFTGDSAADYLENFGSCRKMYLYDMIPSNLEKARQRLQDYDVDIDYRNFGVSSPENEGDGVNIFDESMPSFSLLDKDGEIQEHTENNRVSLVTMDHDIKEPISFIKMDIEGAEIDALNGSRQHICSDHPTLAICSYHRYDHIWRIPELIRSFRSDYRFYMRYNGEPSSFLCSEYVLFAVPERAV